MSKIVKIILWTLAGLLCLVLPGLYNPLNLVRYEIKAKGLTHPICIVLVTDLHSCAYGPDQRELLDVIDREKPDLILLGGDIYDDDLPDGNTLTFLKGVSPKYPCYYVPGNHEYWRDDFSEKMAELDSLGIYRIAGQMVSVDVRGDRLNLCGLDDPYAWEGKGAEKPPADHSFRDQLARLGALFKGGAYTILLTHRPECFDLYASYDFDLVLAGHAHGGQWRIPGIVNGLFAPNQGWFPKYAGGRYEQNGTEMVVSRGLARESTKAPRIYNRPELVILDLQADQ